MKHLRKMCLCPSHKILQVLFRKHMETLKLTLEVHRNSVRGIKIPIPVSGAKLCFLQYCPWLNEHFERKDFMVEVWTLLSSLNIPWSLGKVNPKWSESLAVGIACISFTYQCKLHYRLSHRKNLRSFPNKQ